jgi:hypothetical protein
MSAAAEGQGRSRHRGAIEAADARPDPLHQPRREAA